MPAITSLIPELEEALEHGSIEQRERTLERVTALFLQGAPRFSEDHVELFDDVLSRLIIEISKRALVELSTRLAPVQNAPVMVLRRLARDDDIAVAGPVLVQSKRLTDFDLIDIAHSHGPAHLLAISSRAELSTGVTDILVSRGDRDVLRNVTNNEGARLSGTSYEVLVRRAEQDGLLAERVAQRSDIPPQLFRTLLTQATDVVRQKLLASTRPERREEIRRIIAKVAREVGSKPPHRDFASAQQSVFALHKAGKLGEAQLSAFAKAGQYEETAAALSALCKIPVDVVDRLMSGDRPDPVLIMCKAIGFEWSTVRPVMLVRPEGHRMSPKTIDTALANFDRLSLTTAERVLRFWQVRQSHLAESVQV